MGEQWSSLDECVDWLGEALAQANCCLRVQRHSPRLLQFLGEYRHVSLYRDTYYGDAHALQRANDDYHCILIREHITDRGHYEERVKELEEIGGSGDGANNRNVVKVYVVEDIEYEGFCGLRRQLYLCCDFIMFDLEKQWMHRRAKSRQFSQSQIRTILRECTRGLLRLELSGYSSVRMKHIYFCDDGNNIKVAHPRLFHYASNYQVMSRNYKTPNVFLSPQELAALERSDRHYEVNWISNSFSFGMVMLALITMRDPNELYDYRNCIINHDQVEQLIGLSSNKYSHQLLDMIEKLLNPNEAQRLTFRSLNNRIEQLHMMTGQIDAALLNEQEVKEEVEEVIQPLPQILEEPKFVNFIEPFLRTRAGIGGQYMSLAPTDNPEPLKQPHGGMVTVKERVRYTDTNGKVGHGRYLGSMGRQEKGRGEVRDGEGVYHYQDGQKYIGEWHQGKMEGFGKLYFSNNQLRYEGHFKNGVFHGQGTEYSEKTIPQREEEIDHEYVKLYQGNWVKYEGNYQNDLKHGAGKVYFRKGTWRGNFRRGQPNGQGIFLSYSDNQTTKGTWSDGELTQIIQ